MRNIASSIHNLPIRKERIDGIIVNAHRTISSGQSQIRDLYIRTFSMVLAVSAGVTLSYLTLGRDWMLFFSGAAAVMVRNTLIELKKQRAEHRFEMAEAAELLANCQHISDAQLSELRTLSAQAGPCKQYFEAIMKDRDFVLAGEYQLITTVITSNQKDSTV